MTEAAQRRWGWSASILLHGAVLILGSYLIIRPAQYGIASAPTSTEVELVQEAPPAPAVPVPPVPIPKIPSPVPDIATQPPKPDDVTIPKPLPLPKSSAAPAAPRPAARKMVRTEHHSSAPSRGSTSAMPDYLRNPPPTYPEESREAKEQGTVLVIAKVDREGDVREVSLQQTSGYPQLDRAALNAVRYWKFHPATVGGIAVDSEVAVPVRFLLAE